MCSSDLQLSELRKADLKDGEEEEIESEIALLKNYDAVYSLIRESTAIIDKDDIASLYDLSRIVDKLSAIQPQYKDLQSALEEHYFQLEELFRSFKKETSDMDYEPERLNCLLQRQSDLLAIKRKYGKSLPELIAYRDELSSLVGDNSDLDEEIELSKNMAETARKILIQAGDDLTIIRKSASKRIEKELSNSLDDLLLNCHFEIVFLNSDDDPQFQDNGLDQIDFLIETNVGEGKKSLHKVVSGGEASRLMLAFKELYVKANKTPTVIFDEIDSGLSGEAAMAVAEKIKEISSFAQVLSITHLPQVASKSDHALHVEKKVEKGRTSTSVRRLSLEEKILDVAYLISGGKVTSKQLEYARELVLGEK